MFDGILFVQVKMRFWAFMNKILTYKGLCEKAREYKAKKINKEQYLNSIACFVVEKIENDVNNYVWYIHKYDKRG